MRTVLSGKIVPCYVAFLDDEGNFFTPDSGSCSYSLFNGAAALASDIALTPSSDHMTVVLPGVLNAVSGNHELRRLVVSYQIGGVPYEATEVYRLAASIPYSTTTRQVRDLIGASLSELPDTALDLYGAYLRFVEDVPSPDFTSPYADQAIAARAILDIAPSLRVRLQQSLKTNTQQITRLSKLDPEALLESIYTLYEECLAELTGADVDTVGAGSYIGVSSPPVDYVTGEAPEWPST